MRSWSKDGLNPRHSVPQMYAYSKVSLIIKIEGTPVGEAVASGKAEIGFQQISELLPVKGIDVVGPPPPGAQRVTFFAAGIPVTAKNPVAARRLIQWLASPAAYAAIRKVVWSQPSNRSTGNGLTKRHR